MNTQVAIMMGSDSDLPVMQSAAKVLEDLGVGSEIHVLSAHRTPQATVEFVKDAEAKGIKVFICSAGMSAHLAGVVAAHTALPVIGVPMGKSAAGIDALFSTVQMPPGVPVATVAIDGGKNAGILAAQIIGAGDPNILQNVKMFKEKMTNEIQVKDTELQEKGFKRYLEEKGLI
ncbi:MAG TPA: 5-(carboxyamino)imidazole ribonucleotide mutase [Candidatus Paceibacterota bacterium]